MTVNHKEAVKDVAQKYKEFLDENSAKGELDAFEASLTEVKKFALSEEKEVREGVRKALLELNDELGYYERQELVDMIYSEKWVEEEQQMYNKQQPGVDTQKVDAGDINTPGTYSYIAYQSLRTKALMLGLDLPEQADLQQSGSKMLNAFIPFNNLLGIDFFSPDMDFTKQATWDELIEMTNEKVIQVQERRIQKLEYQHQMEQFAEAMDGKTMENLEIEEPEFDPLELNTVEGVQKQFDTLHNAQTRLQHEAMFVFQHLNDFQTQAAEFEKFKSNQGWSWSGEEEISRAKELNEKKDALESHFEKHKEKLEAKAKKLDTYANEVEIAAYDRYDEMREQGAEDLSEVQNQSQSVNNAVNSNEAQRQALEFSRQQLVERKNDLDIYMSDLELQRAEQEEQGNTLKVQQADLDEFSGYLSDAIDELYMILDDPNVPENKKVEIRKQIDLLVNKEVDLIMQGIVLSDASKMTEEALDSLTAEERNIYNSAIDIEAYMVQVNDGIGALDASMESLKEMQANLIENENNIELSYETNLEGLASFAGGLKQFRENGVEKPNKDMVEQLDAYDTYLDDVSIAPRNRWNRTVGVGVDFIVGNLGRGVSWVGEKMEGLGDGIRWLTEDIPVINLLGESVAFCTDISAGAVQMAGGLVEGVSFMVSNPLKTLKGIGTLVGVYGLEKAGTAWGGMLTGISHWDEEKTGVWIGKVTGELLTTVFTGGGATAAKVPFTAGRAAAKMAYASTRIKPWGYVKALGAGSWNFGSSLGRQASGLFWRTVKAPKRIAQGIVRVGEGVMVGKAPAAAVQMTRRAKVIRTETAKMKKDLLIGDKPAYDLLRGHMQANSIHNAQALRKLTPKQLADMGIGTAKSLKQFDAFVAQVAKIDELTKLQMGAASVTTLYKIREQRKIVDEIRVGNTYADDLWNHLDLTDLNKIDDVALAKELGLDAVKDAAAVQKARTQLDAYIDARKNLAQSEIQLHSFERPLMINTELQDLYKLQGEQRAKNVSMEFTYKDPTNSKRRVVKDVEELVLPSMMKHGDIMKALDNIDLNYIAKELKLDLKKKADKEVAEAAMKQIGEYKKGVKREMDLTDKIANTEQFVLRSTRYGREVRQGTWTIQNMPTFLESGNVKYLESVMQRYIDNDINQTIAKMESLREIGDAAGLLRLEDLLKNLRKSKTELQNRIDGIKNGTIPSTGWTSVAMQQTQIHGLDALRFTGNVLNQPRLLYPGYAVGRSHYYDNGPDYDYTDIASDRVKVRDDLWDELGYHFYRAENIDDSDAATE